MVEGATELQRERPTGDRPGGRRAARGLRAGGRPASAPAWPGPGGWRGRRTVRVAVRGALGLALVAPVGCGALHAPDLGDLYDRAAQAHGPSDNPVVVVPGFMGSTLVDRRTGAAVWGVFRGDYADPETARGARAVGLPMERGAPLRALLDSVEPDAVLDRVTLSFFGLPVSATAYANILGLLGSGGFRDQTLGEAGAIDYGSDHYTCFQFPYDFRRGLQESARELHRFLLEKRAAVQREVTRRYGVTEPEVKFDVGAHSMGGLVLRWYLRYGDADLPGDGSEPALTWAGAELVERAIVVGTPSLGVASALLALVRGEDLGLLLPTYPPAVLGTFPALYQLLPRARHRAVVDASTGESVGDLLDPALWRRMGWGLADPDAAPVLEALLPDVSSAALRREVALEHLEKCLARARRVTDALDRPAEAPSGLSIYLFAGDAEPTPARLRVDPATGAISGVETAPGDGTVTRASALGDERPGDAEWRPALRSPIPWAGVTFIHSDHLGLTRDPTFADNLLFTLLERPRRTRANRTVPAGPATSRPATSRPGAGGR